MTVAGIFGNIGHDTWLTDVLVGGLESMIKGFPNDGLTVMTDQRTVEVITEARHPNVELIGKGIKPQVLFLVNTKTSKDIKVLECALLLGIPVYQIFNGNPVELNVHAQD